MGGRRRRLQAPITLTPVQEATRRVILLILAVLILTFVISCATYVLSPERDRERAAQATWDWEIDRHLRATVDSLHREGFRSEGGLPTPRKRR